MDTRRWTNPSQPQTLQIAVFLLYINAALLAIAGGILSPIGILIIAGGVGAGFGIANERRWGYGLGLAMAFLPFALRLALGASVTGGSLINVNLLFEIALIALLLHPQSRDYQRIWFS